MTKALLATVVVLAASLSAFAAEPPKQDVSALAKGANTFALNLYAKLPAGENSFFSPHSIHTALAMTYAGAKGDTAAQMAKVLHYDLPADKLHAAFAAFLGDLNNPRKIGKDPAYQLVVANALWAARDYPFNPEYMAMVKKDYSAPIENLDFNQPEPSRKTINDWVEKQTKDKIKDLIPAGVITPDTRLVLTNAIYFKSAWMDAFQKEATKDQPFHLSADKSVDVPMMHATRDRTGYFAGDDFDMVELPYLGNDLSMLVLVPKKVDGLADLEKKLSADNLRTWVAGLRGRRVELSLPRFKMTAQFSLADTLKSMGMTDAFGGKADFSGMATAEKLYISAVIHKAFVDVNEEGTEAAAATAVAIGAMSAVQPQEPVVVKADRPFTFVIRHRATDAILFMGRVANPK